MSEIKKTTPRDVFFHLLLMVTLYISVISIISILFQLINKVVPDALSSYQYYSGSFRPLRTAIASVIVAWPICMYLSHIVGKELATEPERREIKIRKWLLYLTLFVSAIAIIIDLIAVINNFLQGELVWSFALKVLSVFLASGAVFWYYSWDLKQTVTSPVSRIPKITAIVSTIAVILAIVGSFIVTGSPTTQRARRFDENRISNLQMVQYQIFDYYQRKSALPNKITELQNDTTGFIVPNDPETNTAYEYRVTGKESFSICATFNLPNNTDAQTQPKPYYDTLNNESWQHDAGHVCFSRKIDPELLSPIKDQPLITR